MNKILKTETNNVSLHKSTKIILVYLVAGFPETDPVIRVITLKVSLADYKQDHIRPKVTQKHKKN